MRFQKVLSLLPALALVLLPAQAADIYVATNGNNLTGDGSQGNPYQTIQFAYNTASDDDTILVMAGTYQECLFLSGLGDQPPVQRSVHLVAEAFDAGDPSTRADTVIDGNGQCPVGLAVVTIGAPTASIEGFTITGGTSSGLWSIGGITITNNIIEGNSSSSGGGLYLYPDHCFYGDVDITIANNTIRNNSVTFEGPPLSGLGGGVLVGLYPEYFMAGDPLTTPDGCFGGGGDILIENNTFENNTTEYDGAAIYAFTNSVPLDGITDTTAAITITQNTISGNTAGTPPGAYAGYGGGVFATTFGVGTELLDVSGNQFLGNTATGYGGGIWAGVYAYRYADHALSVDDNTITGNTASTGGGAEISARVIDLVSDQNAYLGATGNTINGNTATNNDETGGGGGLSVGIFTQRTTAPGVQLVVEDNLIRSNDADLDGGGLELRVISDAENIFDPGDTQVLPSTAELEFSNNLVVLNETANSFDDAVGAGIMAFMQAFGPEAFAIIDMDLNTVSENTSQTGAGGIEVESYTGFDTSFLGEGTSMLEIDSTVDSYNSGFGIGGPLPGDEGIFTPGGSGGDTANLSIEVSYSDFFGNSVNYESWIQDRTGAQGNISTDPLLDALTYVPLECSPTLDSGNPLNDYSDEPKPDGGRVNMGHTGGTLFATASLGDASGDGAVDGLDILAVAVAFGSSFGTPRWDPAADLDSNNLVDGTDLALISGDFGESCP